VLQFGLSTFLIGLVLSVAIRPWLALSWWQVFRRCASIAAALSVGLLLRQERRSLSSYGFSDFRAGKRQLLFGLLLGVSALGVMLALGLLTGVFRMQITDDTARLWRALIGFLPAAFLVSILEELVFRGVILQHLLGSSKLVAVLTSSSLYAVVHLKTVSTALGMGFELVGLFLLGCVLALSYLLTGQLYLSVGLHASLAYGAQVNKLCVQFLDHAPSWLVGTSRIVNGLAGWVALLGIAGIIIWQTRGSRTGERQHG